MPQAIAYTAWSFVQAAGAIGVSQATAIGIMDAALKVTALSAVNAVVQNQNKPEQTGGMTTLTINPSEPRRLQVGKRMTSGVLVDWYVRGSKNQNLYLVVYLGEGPMGRITKVQAGGRTVYSSPINHGVRTTIPDFRSGGDRLWVTYYDGRPGQTADANLVSQGLGWPSTAVGTGCAYAIVEQQWDSDNLRSPVALTFEIEGAKFYDRRKDSTAGGSGTHRADNPATWELSDNPAVALDHYLLGRYLGGIKTFGIGLDPEDVPYDKFAARANLCDEDVAKKAGGTHKRYRANGFLFADRSYSDTIKDLCRAMASRPADFGGRIGILDSHARTPVMTITDDDVINEAAEEYTPKKSWGELVTQVSGTFIDPNQNYNQVPYPDVTDPAWVTADGGSSKTATVDFEMETDPERAQRLAWLYAMRERRQAKLTGIYKLRCVELEQGDWFTRQSDKFAPDGKVFEVISSELDPATLTVTIVAFEVDPADSAWTTDIPSDFTSTGVGSDDTIPELLPPTVTVTPSPVTDGTISIPGVSIGVNYGSDPIATDTQIEIARNNGSGGPDYSYEVFTRVIPAGSTVAWVSGELMPNTNYVLRVRAVFGDKYGTWSAWQTFTSPADYAVGITEVSSTDFADGIEPVGIVDTLPSPTGYTGPQVVFLTTDLKLYRYTGSAWTSAVPSVDITGQLSDSQLASIAAAKITGQLASSQIVSLDATKVTGQLSDSQLASIAAAKLTGTIATTQIANDAITTAKIAAGAITAAEIAADSITTAKIAAGAITATEIAAGAITTAKIAAGAITANEIASNAITTAKISAGAITAGKLAAGSVVAGNIAAGAITATEIAAGAITTAKLAAGAITANKLSANAVTAGKIAAGAVSASQISVTQLSAISSNLGSITGGSINIGSGKFVVDSSGNVTIKSASSGQRLELTNSLVRVYDSSNQLRVRVGIW